ncbi:MAG: hypothetical protein KAH44_07895 [Oricola sp.]|nr:hypothetical protein [Oricola sp.]|tara:strand:+ start:24414 stop:24566 length:153 start_codon:yes stop_codon:yes gene_type:complete
MFNQLAGGEFAVEQVRFDEFPPEHVVGVARRKSSRPVSRMESVMIRFTDA